MRTLLYVIALAVMLVVPMQSQAWTYCNPYAGNYVAYGRNPYTGGMYLNRGGMNPVTGTWGNNATYINPRTGRTATSTNFYNPYTGNTATRSMTFNPYTNNLRVNESAYNVYTGWGSRSGYIYNPNGGLNRYGGVVNPYIGQYP